MSTVNCKICGSNIVEEYLKKQYYQEEYPEILIGPYCSECFQKIRICSGCQKPFVKEEEIKYYKKGLWYCDECASGLSICEKCGSISHKLVEIGGIKMCESCLNSKYFYCNYCQEYHGNESNVFKNKGLNILKAQYPSISDNHPNGICKVAFDKLAASIAPEKVSECKHCGHIYGESEMATDKYCKRCYENFNTCGSCGDKDPSVSIWKVDNKSESLCNSCKNKLATCDICHKLTRDSNKIEGACKTHIVCSYCNRNKLKECSKCFDLHSDAESDECYKCKEVYSENKCTKCGMIRDFDKSCRGCGASRDTVYNYSTKPQLVFNRLDDRTKDLFFGCENEMSFSSESSAREHLRSLYKAFDPTILLAKSDGSITGPGYELVTQPMTLGFFNQLNVSLWFCKDVVRSSSCGLHIHMSRDSFSSEVHLYKLINFIHNNSGFCNKVAGRDYNGYNCELERKPSQAVKKGASSRYCRVNTSNNTTVEIRMFAGCVSEFELRYRVEFLHALWSFTKERAIKEVTLDGFKTFIKENRKVYYNFGKFLTSV